ncbi:MAG: class I SAM-dependent methyltransferase [Nitrososphaerales archaeon]|nr:class I SAM-dependent methyltransferase [Nitrososphaerales archaeon]
MRKDPRSWLNELEVREGMVVADLGAGKGLYSALAADLVGTRGHVYAVEPDPKRAAMILRRAFQSGLNKLEVVQSGVEGMKSIPQSSVDLAFSRNSLHHFCDMEEAFAQVLRILKSGGRFCIRDVLWAWWTRFGTRRDDISSLNSGGFKDFRVSVSGRVFEATLVK